jgi:diguanylate cyclase (GGDEF)-like protein
VTTVDRDPDDASGASPHAAPLMEAVRRSEHLVAVLDDTGDEVYLNPAARRLFLAGKPGEDGNGKVLAGLVGELRKVVADGRDRWTGELDVVAADGEPRWLRAEVVVHDGVGRRPRYSLIARDVSDQRRVEQSLLRRATHDRLTGLPDRGLLFERIERAADALRGQGARHAVALLFIDIDHFRSLNDRLGHELGDELLVEVARRISSVVRPGDTVARFGGDQFVVLCDRLDDSGDAVVIAHRVDLVLRPPVRLGDHEVRLGASIGISYADPDAVDPLATLRDADAAMSLAKAEGRGQWVIFDEQLRDRAATRSRMETGLRETRNGEELELRYQPSVSLSTGRITGVEALVRWRRDGEWVAPEDFIPVAEETGLVVPIGAWVLQTAVEQVAQWQQLPGWQDLRLAVNVSPRQLQQPEFAAMVARVADWSSLRRGSLWLEITERLLLEDLGLASQRMERLARLGARLALDDFGTGYSSLSYLRRLPVDAVKLDRSFVSGVTTDPGDRAIVEAVVHLAKALGKETIAEGVERADQAELLRSFGCDAVQGHLIAGPVDAPTLAGMLESSLGGGRIAPAPA